MGRAKATERLALERTEDRARACYCKQPLKKKVFEQLSEARLQKCSVMHHSPYSLDIGCKEPFSRMLPHSGVLRTTA